MRSNQNLSLLYNEQTQPIHQLIACAREQKVRHLVPMITNYKLIFNNVNMCKYLIKQRVEYTAANADNKLVMDISVTNDKQYAKISESFNCGIIS